MESTSSNIVNIFKPITYLDTNKEYEMAVTGVELFNTFSNIIEGKNSVFKYSNNNGDIYNTIVFPAGCYNLREINEYIQSKLEKPPISRLNGQTIPTKGIKLSKDESTDKVVMNVEFGWVVKFKDEQNSLAEILGFSKLLDYPQGFHESDRIFNILSVHRVCIINDLVKGCSANGVATNIHSFSPTVEPGFKIVKEFHTRSVYFPVLTKIINKMTTRLVDENGELLRLTGGTVTFIYHIREIKNSQHCSNAAYVIITSMRK